MKNLIIALALLPPAAMPAVTDTQGSGAEKQRIGTGGQYWAGREAYVDGTQGELPSKKGQINGLEKNHRA